MGRPSQWVSAPGTRSCSRAHRWPVGPACLLSSAANVALTPSVCLAGVHPSSYSIPVCRRKSRVSPTAATQLQTSSSRAGHPRVPGGQYSCGAGHHPLPISSREGHLPHAQAARWRDTQQEAVRSPGSGAWSTAAPQPAPAGCVSFGETLHPLHSSLRGARAAEALS